MEIRSYNDLKYNYQLGIVNNCQNNLKYLTIRLSSARFHENRTNLDAFR